MSVDPGLGLDSRLLDAEQTTKDTPQGERIIDSYDDFCTSFSAEKRYLGLSRRMIRVKL